MKRCEWCGTDPLYVAYHDEEWGVPVYNDTALFESLILDGAQAGLSWLTILRKRENYRKAYDGFSIEKIARYTEKDRARLLANQGIVRNRLKIDSSIKNAQATLQIQEKHGSLSDYLWRYVDGKPIQNSWKSMQELPAETKLSAQISKDLKKAGFNFVGPTIIYAFMQAVGMVNDHMVYCFRYEEVKAIQ